MQKDQRDYLYLRPLPSMGHFRLFSIETTQEFRRKPKLITVHLTETKTTSKLH